MLSSLEELVKRQAERIDQLEARLSELEAENKVLKVENAELKSENAELKEKLGLNSKNSSIPSSKELYKKQKTEKKSSGRKRGGQKGHEGHSRDKMTADEENGRASGRERV